MIKLFTAIFGLIVVSSVVFGYDFMDYFLLEMNNMLGFLLLLIWITLLQLEEK